MELYVVLSYRNLYNFTSLNSHLVLVQLFQYNKPTVTHIGIIWSQLVWTLRINFYRYGQHKNPVIPNVILLKLTLIPCTDILCIAFSYYYYKSNCLTESISRCLLCTVLESIRTYKHINKLTPHARIGGVTRQRLNKYWGPMVCGEILSRRTLRPPARNYLYYYST